MSLAVTKMSSKGQVVIPADMRKKIKRGEKILLISDDGRIILIPESEADERFVEDLEFAKRTNDALDNYGKGKGNWKKLNSDEFLEELESW